MVEDFRVFEVTDPAGRAWRVRFLWQQNAVSIRHADAVDVKFRLSDGHEEIDKVVALPDPHLRALSAASGRPVTDPWCARLAASHLRRLIETGADMEKPLVTPTLEQLQEHAATTT